jgi:hypothetical protein
MMLGCTPCRSALFTAPHAMLRPWLKSLHY